MAERNESFEVVGVGLHPPGNPKLHGHHLWSDRRWENINKRGQSLGISIRKPASLIYSPLSLRPLKLLPPRGQHEYISAVFRGFFELGLDIDSPRELLDFIQREGLECSALQQALDDATTLHDVEGNELLWGSRRLRMIPTLEYGSERLSGILDERGVESFLNLLFD